MKRLISSVTAMVMAFSLCVPAIAADTPMVHMRLKCPSDVRGDTSDEIREGVLPCGLSYKIVPMTVEEIEALYSNVSSRSYHWVGNVTVPIKNATGTNGKQLGNDFIVAPDKTAEVCVGGLPSTMPSVNIGVVATNGMWSDWVPGVKEDQKVIFTPAEGYEVYYYRVNVSTSEAVSAPARFLIDTY